MRRFAVSVTLLILVSSYALSANMTTIKDYVSAFHHATNNSTMPDSVAKFYVNQGIAEVAYEARALRGKDTIVTTSGNSDYSLNSDCYIDSGIITVQLQQSGIRSTLTKALPDSAWKELTSGKLTGCPQFWFQWGNMLTITPEGSALACTLVVNYVKQPTYKTDDSMTVQLGTIYSWPAVSRAAQRYQEAVGIK